MNRRSAGRSLGAELRRDRISGLPVAGRYLEVSHRPLHILLFLLPLILLYELGTWQYATGSAVGVSENESITISAYKMLVLVFDTLGAGGLYLPGIALVVVLGLWHVLCRDDWTIHAGVPVVMFLESALLAIPLLVFDQLFSRVLASEFGPLMQAAAGGGGWSDFSWQARLTLSIGAGLYEELVFRMILIALVHAVLVDFARMKSARGTLIALFVSTVAFACYHDGVWAGPGLVNFGALVFYLFSGLYFGSVYIVRGFGVVVGAHAMYDVVAVGLLSGT